MLRRCCCLCSRHLLLQEPSTSTSTSASYAAASSSSAGAGRGRSGTKHAAAARSRGRAFSTFVGQARQEAVVGHLELHKEEQHPAPTKSYWKGKARAIDPPPTPTRQDYRHVRAASDEGRSAPVSEAVAVSQDKTSAGFAAISEDRSEPDRRRHSLETHMAAGNTSSAQFVILDGYMADLESGELPDSARLREDLGRIREASSPSGIPAPPVLDETMPDLESLQDSSTYNILQFLLISYLKSALDHGSFRKKTLHTILRRAHALCQASHTSLNQDSFVDLLDSLLAETSRRKRWRTTLDVSMFGHELLGEWTTSLLTLYTQALLELEDYSSAPPVSSLLSKLFPLPISLYCQLLTAYLASRDFEQVQDLFSNMQHYQITPDLSTYQAILDGYQRASPPQSSNLYVEILHDLLPITDIPPAELLNGMVQARIATGDLSGAHEAFQLFRQATGRKRSASQPQLTPPEADAQASLLLQPDAASPSSPGGASTDLTASSQPLRTSTALQLSQQYANGLRPSSTTFSSLVSGYTALGDLDSALDFYVEMLDQGHEPDPFVSQALLEAFRQGDRPADEVAVAVRAIEGRGMAMENAVTEDARAGSGVVSRPVQLSRLSSQDAEPVSISNLLGEIEAATLAGQTIDPSFVPDLLSHLRRSHQIGAVDLSHIAQHLRRATASSPTMYDLNTMLKSLADRESRALDVRSQRFRGNAALANLSPAYNGTPAELQAFLSTIQQLHTAKAEPNAHTISILMQRFANNGGSPTTLWSYFRWQILDRKLTPAPHHITALMTAYVNQGDIYGARRAMDRGEALGIPLTVHHYTILINYFLRQGQKGEAEAVYSQMLAKGIEPDLHVYAILARWAAKHGLVDRVRDIIAKVAQALPDVKQPNVVLQSVLLTAYSISKQFLQGQVSLRQALEEGMQPDRQLMHINFRQLAALRKHLRFGRGGDVEAASLEKAIELAEENQRIMRMLLAKVGRPYKATETGVIDKREVQALLKAVERNGRLRSAGRK